MLETFTPQPTETDPRTTDVQAIGRVSVSNGEEFSLPPLPDPFSDDWYETREQGNHRIQPETQKELAESVMDNEHGDALRWKVEAAMGRSEFVSTPELAEGLSSYYESHYATAGIIQMGLEEPHEGDTASAEAELLRSIIDSSIHSEQSIQSSLDALVTYGNTPLGPQQTYVQDVLPLLAAVRLARLRDPGDSKLARSELTAQLLACQSLFAEVSVGVTTLGSEEMDLVRNLNEKVVEKIELSGLFDFTPGKHTYHPKDLPARPIRVVSDIIGGRDLSSIEWAQQKFWEDTRHAGQLEFHNTTHFRDVWQQGSIMTRRMQALHNGAFKRQTAETLDDSVHSPTVHFSESFDPTTYRGRFGALGGGTFAIPLGELIKITPYARNAQYGTLLMKPGSDMATHIPRNDRLGNIGAGGPDQQGGSGIDRTFYRSPADVSPDAPLDQAPDGYAYNFRDIPMTWVQLGEKEQHHDWENGFGTGEHIPDRFVIPIHDGGLQENEEVIAASIRQLQNESIARYPHRIVAPLRAGAMNFYIKDDGIYNSRPVAQFNRINGQIKSTGL